MNEEAKLRALLERVHASPGMDFIVPKRHNHLTNVLKGVRGGKFKSWVLMPADVDKAISAIKKAVKDGIISEEEINGSCRKILQSKEV